MSIAIKEPNKHNWRSRKESVFKRRGQVMEMYFGLGMQIPQIAYILCVADYTIAHDISYCLKKPEANMALQSKMNEELIEEQP